MRFLQQISSRLIFVKWSRCRVHYDTGMVHALRLCLFMINLLSVGLYGLAAQARPLAATDNLTMVICSEYGTYTLAVDANGSPAEPSKHCSQCLDCFSFPPFALNDAVTTLRAPEARPRVSSLPSDPEPVSLAQAFPLPRGPPSGVVAELVLRALGAQKQTYKIGIAEHLRNSVQRIDIGNKHRAKNEVAR